MASRPRRGSKELPPNLSELMNKLIKHGASFIKVFDNSEPKMRQIVGEFQVIAKEVKEMQERTDTVRRGGAVIGGVALIGIIAGPFTGGASLLAAGAAATGGVAVVGANVTKVMKENGSATKVEKLGKEFLEIVETLKNDLEEIKTTCEKLEQQSAEVQAKNTLTDVDEFQRTIRRVSELRERSKKSLVVAVTVMEVIGNLLLLFLGILRVTATPEEDKKLRDSIIQSADQCQKVVVEFDKMKTELKDFTEK